VILTGTIKAGQMVGMAMHFDGLGAWIMRFGNRFIGAKVPSGIWTSSRRRGIWPVRRRSSRRSKKAACTW